LRVEEALDQDGPNYYRKKRKRPGCKRTKSLGIPKPLCYTSEDKEFLTLGSEYTDPAPSMQSGCRLYSSSLPDQPRNNKLSKRPLDWIVTNEGPSKRSYVASSSKQPSESRVFPEVDSFVQRLANDSIRSKQIDNLSSSDKLISILGEEFNNVATVISFLS
jgi:hypothetical protein